MAEIPDTIKFLTQNVSEKTQQLCCDIQAVASCSSVVHQHCSALLPKTDKRGETLGQCG